MAALDGLRILDLTQYEAGTSCTQALAWLGADVVKVERPGSGDPGRGISGQEYGFEDSEYFIYWNSNKRSVTLDLSSDEGRNLLLELLPKFDVFIENFGPGVVEKLRLDYETIQTLHPTVIYARIKGFGSSGPYSGYKCFDSVAQAAAGALSVTGYPDGPPTRPGTTVGDSGTGVQMAFLICAAYAHRLKTGEGQLIELSMQEAMTYYMRTTIAMGSKWGTQAARRVGNGHGPLVNLFPCKPFGENDYVYLMAVTDKMWETLCRTIGRDDLLEDERFRTGKDRYVNQEALRPEIEAWTSTQTKKEAMAVLAEAGVPISAVFDTKDLFEDPHLEDRGFVETLHHEGVGEFRILGSPFRMSSGHAELRAAPTLGRHTDQVLAEELGLGPGEIEDLRGRGVIGNESG